MREQVRAVLGHDHVATGGNECVRRESEIDGVGETPGLKQLPVVILTSSREDSDRSLGYENGVNSFLVKSVSFDGFTEVVRKIESYWLTLNVGPND